MMCVCACTRYTGGVGWHPWAAQVALCMHVLTCFSTSDTHLLVHGRQVPDVTDEGPAGHHPQQVTDHAVLGAVPESISKLYVILRKVQKHREVQCKWGTVLNERRSSIDRQDWSTLMATGYIVAPISKLPFLNIMTDVLLTHVPVETRQIRRLKGTEFCEFCPNPHKIAAQASRCHQAHQETILTQSYLGRHKAKHETDVDTVSLSLCMVTLTLWKYQYGKLCLVVHMILQPGSNTKT